MPWRSDPTPYHVWISEIMLQQTRIEAVIPYYERFLKAFPDVRALAAAEDDRLMKLWEGLGYYSRARNLKKAAEIVARDFGGELPRRAEELRRLPGIGDYTAGAVASIAYGEAEPAVDGNVLRVAARLGALADDVMQPSVRRRITEALRGVYPTGPDAADLTQGLMELGERVCLPNGAPRCAGCPAAALCRARRAGRETDYPVRSPKPARRVEERTVLLLRRGGRYALRRRGPKGLLAGLWELPGIEGPAGPEAVRAALAGWGLEALSVEPCGSASHVFTHVEWRMTGYRVLCAQTCAAGEAEENENAPGALIWRTAEEIRARYAVPTAFRAFVRKMEPGDEA